MNNLTPIEMMTIDRMDGLVSFSTLERVVEDGNAIIHEMMKEGFSKEETITYLWYCISNARVPLMINPVGTIELDTTEIESQGFIHFLQQHGITFEVLTWRGPGGGNPLIRYRGLKQDLMHMVIEHWEDEGLMNDFKEDAI